MSCFTFIWPCKKTHEVPVMQKKKSNSRQEISVLNLLVFSTLVCIDMHIC